MITYTQNSAFVSSGFVNDVSRIAVRNYKRSDGDVLRTHARTVDAQGYKFKIEKGSETCCFNSIYY